MTNTREDRLISQMTETSRAFYVWIAFLVGCVVLALVAYGIQLRKGLIVTGLRDEVSWGIYISTFVFWVGVSKGGTMVSAILRITNADWRTPMTRLSEAITVLALITGAPMIIADLGRPDRIWHLLRYGRIQSPLIWDFISVMTYLTACVIYFYLPLIPDVALLAQDLRMPAWRQRFYQRLSLHWKNTPAQKQLLERAIHVMAIIVIPLAVAVHTVVSWIFAMTLRPGWNSTIYGPYFVVGAIYSGAAAVIVAMWLLRRTMHLEAYLQPEHFRKIGKLLLAATLVYLYFNINEYLTVGYKLEGFERDLVEALFVGRFARFFWSVQVIGVLIPIAMLMSVLLVPALKRFSIAAVGTASLLIVLGAWAKRFLIVVPTLQTPFLPAQRIPAEWTRYSPTWVEWAIVGGVLAWFLLAYTLTAKLFPIVSIWETREPEPSNQISEGRSEPSMLGARAGVMATMIVLLMSGVASAKDKPKPKATSLVVSYELQVPNQNVGNGPSGIPGVESTIENPFARRYQAAAPAVPAVLASARLQDAEGAPLAFKPVTFSIKTYFGNLGLGVRPSGADGVAHLKITDRHMGAYTITADFSGDQQLAASRGSAEVIASPRPEPSLPQEGMLIDPYPTFWITMPFVLFFGTMWGVFAYVFYALRRLRRLGITPAGNSSTTAALST